MRRMWHVVFFPLFLVFLALGGLVVMLLWNWLVPELFAGHAVTYWQALGLLALSRILFGRMGGRGGRGGWHRGGKYRMAFESMSPEEREKMREAMRRRWGFGDRDDR